MEAKVGSKRRLLMTVLALMVSVVSVFVPNSVRAITGSGTDVVGHNHYYNEDTTMVALLGNNEEGLNVDDRSGGICNVSVLDNGVKITSEKACVVLVTEDAGSHYTRIPAVRVDGEEDTYKFTFAVTSDMTAMVVLNGDGNRDGAVSSADLNILTQSLIGETLPAHRSLSSLEMLLLDVTGDDQVTSADVNRITRSLIGNSLLAYLPIGWQVNPIYAGNTYGRQNIRVVAYNFYSATPAGNPGARGNCTWFAWYWRATDPRSLGALNNNGRNARTWHIDYAYRGVGRTPVVGAVFQTPYGGGGYGHVGVVTGINEDGSIEIREMNYLGYGIVNDATITADQVGNFNYIY